MREVYLQVGPVKTGSTFLQDLLWRYRDDLTRQGCYHPGTYENEMWLATNDRAHPTAEPDQRRIP